jgi:amino acid adenylation domain-containing protein
LTQPQTDGALEIDGALIGLGDGGPLEATATIVAHRRIEAIARANPHEIAVTTRDETLTYAELDARTDAVSRTLRSRGIGREKVVGICLPKRLDVLVAVLGVLKAGGAYLPLDLVQPLERRRYMIEDAGVSALITLDAWAADLNSGSGPVITPEDWAREPSGPVPPAEEVLLGDLAYIIYTSGSTGRPKGVMIEQRSLAAYVDWGISNFTHEELSGVLMATSFGFDMSIFEFMIPLAAGGRLVLVDNLFEIHDVHHRGVTLVNAVPSLMAAALAAGVELPPTVRTAVFCGEALSFEVSEAMHAHPGIERVMNTYGPTEDTVYSTFVEVPAGVRPTIGRPLPGTQAYVLDEQLNLVARGDPGELCLGGVGLARGYRRNDDLTRERFVPNPLGGMGSEFLYRTGDLARWEDDGSLQHLGRIDNQIKLRGVRIEPGDVEEAILRHPAVRQAVVMARERPAGRKWLVAYIVCDPGAEPEGSELRGMLRETVPKPMIPSVFVKLAEMPLNANGKLDRASLPEPLTKVLGSRPLTETEQALAEIWRELIPLEGLPGPDDDYFELGGDSLTAFEIFARIERQARREISPNVLLEASTLGALATFIDSGEKRGRLIKLHRDGALIPTVYVHSGAGGMLTLRMISEALGPEQPLFGIQAFVDRNVEEGDVRGVQETAVECLASLREAQPHGPYIIAGHSVGGHIAYEIAVRLEEAGETVLFLGLLDSSAPHTLRWPGRLMSRIHQLVGTGSEPRRQEAHKAAWQAVSRRLGAARDEGAAETEVWMRNLGALEKAYHPPTYAGRMVVYTTTGSAVFTGSATLGWERYVTGPIEARRVPGEHSSMLRFVAAPMDADIRQAQERGRT